jgi:hypothetical protein
MNVRVLSTLAILAVIVSLAAVWAVQREVADWRTPAHGKLIFPELAKRVNDAGKLIVRHAGKQLTIIRRDPGWVLAESDNYPVQGKTVQRALVALSELRWLEPKTKKPDRYAKLQLQNPDAKGAVSRRIEAFDRSGNKFADVLVGKENLHLQAISEGGTYIRKPDDNQAWLASGQLVVGGEPKDWLINKIVNVPRARMARAVLRHPNGDVITIEKTRSAAEPFAVAGIPAGKALISDLYPKDIGRALENFEIHDARKAEKVPFTKDKTVVATFETLDGLVIRLRVTPVNDTHWARLDTAETKSSDTRVQQAAKRIADRTNGWAFRIPEFETVHIMKPLAKVLENSGGKS